MFYGLWLLMHMQHALPAQEWARHPTKPCIRHVEDPKPIREAEGVIQGPLDAVDREILRKYFPEWLEGDWA